MARVSGLQRQETEAERRVSRSYKDGFGGAPLRNEYGPNDSKPPLPRTEPGVYHQLSNAANGVRMAMRADGHVPADGAPLSDREVHLAERLAASGHSSRVLIAAAWAASGPVERELLDRVFGPGLRYCGLDNAAETPF